MAHLITLIAGDGIGPEVAEAAEKVLAATGVAIDHLMGHNDGEKPFDYHFCTRSLRSTVHQTGLRFNAVTEA